MLADRTLDDELMVVTGTLAAFGEPDRVASARTDKRSTLEFLAVRVPIVRDAVRRGFGFYERSGPEILAVWDHVWRSSPYYEVMSAALIYYQDVNPGSADLFSTARNWIYRVENWGHCDSLSAVFARICRNDREQVYPFLHSLSVSPHGWHRRISVVSLVMGLRRAAFSVPLDQVWPILDRVADDRDPYVAKGVAWVIREAVRAEPSLGLAYLKARRSRFSSPVWSRVQGELRRTFPMLNRTLE